MVMRWVVFSLSVQSMRCSDAPATRCASSGVAWEGRSCSNASRSCGLDPCNRRRSPHRVVVSQIAHESWKSLRWSRGSPAEPGLMTSTSAVALCHLEVSVAHDERVAVRVRLPGTRSSRAGSGSPSTAPRASCGSSQPSCRRRPRLDAVRLLPQPSHEVLRRPSATTTHAVAVAAEDRLLVVAEDDARVRVRGAAATTSFDQRNWKTESPAHKSSSIGRHQRRGPRRRPSMLQWMSETMRPSRARLQPGRRVRAYSRR